VSLYIGDMQDLASGIDAALRYFKTRTALADALGIHRSAISQWTFVPVWPKNRVFEIEHLTKGKVSRHEMRPDLFGPAPKKRRA
jgi:DNA-binding transcriptional regulator YdaS (Cro superfamily)